MSFCDEPIPVELGEDGLAASDWGVIYHEVSRAAREAARRAKKGPSISARQHAANMEATRLRILPIWRRRFHGIGGS